METRPFEVTERMLSEAQNPDGNGYIEQPFNDRISGVPLSLGAAERAKWAEYFNRLPVMVQLGAFIDIEDPAMTKVVVPKFEAYHLGGMGGPSMNGGMIAAMFDCAIGVAGALQFPQQMAGTIDLSIKIVRAICSPRVVAYSRTTKKTRSVAFVEALAFDGDNRFCASANGIVATA
jgi:acyl-coenzyme A thioesterase PaaI-like protein